MAVTQTNATDETVTIESLSDRERRALTEVMSTLDDQGAVADNPDLYEVVSHSGKSYAVDLGGDEPHCTCADHLHRGKICKHIERVRYAVGIKPVPADADVDGQLGEYVTTGEPRVAMTDGGVATLEAGADEPSTDSDPRDDYIPIGVDEEGGHHVYRTTDETVHVIEDGERTYRFDLEDLDKTVDDWIDHVEDKRGGFETQHLYKTAADALGGAF